MASDQISLNEYLTQLNQIDLREASNYSSSTLHPTYGAVPNVTVGAGIGTGGNVLSSGVTTSVGSPVWTTTSPVWTTTGTGYTINTPGTMNTPSAHIDQGGQVHLQGDNADLVINKKSLKTWMEKVEERLNILTPNPELEKEWDELRRLGERYRKLEKKCKEKSDVWNKLKAMPPQKLD